MYVTFDYKCPTCEKNYPNVFIRRAEMDAQRCGKCKDALVRLPAGTRTTFKDSDRKAIK